MQRQRRSFLFFFSLFRPKRRSAAAQVKGFCNLKNFLFFVSLLFHSFFPFHLKFVVFTRPICLSFYPLLSLFTPCITPSISPLLFIFLSLSPPPFAKQRGSKRGEIASGFFSTRAFLEDTHIHLVDDVPLVSFSLSSLRCMYTCTLSISLVWCLCLASLHSPFSLHKEKAVPFFLLFLSLPRGGLLFSREREREETHREREREIGCLPIFQRYHLVSSECSRKFSSSAFVVCFSIFSLAFFFLFLLFFFFVSPVSQEDGPNSREICFFKRKKEREETAARCKEGEWWFYIFSSSLL